MSYKQAIGITLPSTEIELELFAVLIDANGVQVGDMIVDSFTEFGIGHYTLVYSDFPDDFFGTIAIYEVGSNRFVGASEINPTPTVALVFNEPVGGTRQRDINIYKGATTRLTWIRNNTEAPTEIVFTIKRDMVDPVEDAILVVSLTNGCEWVLGAPSDDASLATLSSDDYFIYLIMKSELTDMFDVVIGVHQYDVTQTTTQGITVAGFGQVNIILGGT